MTEFMSEGMSWVEECNRLCELPIHEKTGFVVCGTYSKILPPTPTPEYIPEYMPPVHCTVAGG